jgi:hypothetical protein
MVHSLKPLRRLALEKKEKSWGRSVGNLLEARYRKEMGRHGEYCKATHSMQKHDKTYQHTMDSLTGKMNVK